ncbi:MAG TPA: SCO family protein [Bryobacteraceae bacterium]|nr:SCO family protein [Bryobacteraceae bacterium]
MRRAAILALAAAGAACGQASQGIVPWVERTRARPDLLKKVALEQKLNALVPLDLVFRDEHGRPVPLGTYFGKRPVVLSLAYYECPMLCTLALNGQLRAFRSLDFSVGREFEVVVVSINPTETPALAAAKKATYLSSYRRPGAENGWHFLTGTEPSIRTLASAVGYRYEYDPESKQYAHPTGLIVLTPEGRIAAYQYGVEYSARDLRPALVAASNEKIGSPVAEVLLYCFHYDPATGKYSLPILNLVRVGAAATILGLMAFIAIASRRHRTLPLKAEARP